LSKAGWSLGWVSAIDSEGRTIWIADAYRGDRKRFVVRADEKLTAFVELELVIRAAHVVLLRKKGARAPEPALPPLYERQSVYEADSSPKEAARDCTP
jgi:hypothetical protein